MDLRKKLNKTSTLHKFCVKEAQEYAWRVTLEQSMLSVLCHSNHASGLCEQQQDRNASERREVVEFRNRIYALQQLRDAFEKCADATNQLNQPQL